LKESSKNRILSLSSSWIACVLNLLPGLGTGYIYQRRWKAYWLTNIFSAFWISIGLYRDLSIDPSDPAIYQGDSFRFLGLLTISIITSIEASIKVKKTRESIRNRLIINSK
tara:strand:+ start:2936 stop:3268 length:333 start_codon:yes stop_codon:yes gene_type:complete